MIRPDKLLEWMVRVLMVKGYYGTLVIYIENGGIVRIKREETIKQI